MSVTSLPTLGAENASARQLPVDHKPLSRNERVVLKQLQMARRPLKAYQLLETLQESGFRAPMTIYRALGSLMRRRLVRKIASTNSFVATAPDAAAAPGAYCICRTCGRAIEKPLKSDDVARLFANAGMRIDQVFIEAHGECQDAECVRRVR